MGGYWGWGAYVSLRRHRTAGDTVSAVNCAPPLMGNLIFWVMGTTAEYRLPEPTACGMQVCCRAWLGDGGNDRDTKEQSEGYHWVSRPLRVNETLGGAPMTPGRAVFLLFLCHFFHVPLFKVYIFKQSNPQAIRRILSFCLVTYLYKYLWLL